MKCLPRCSLTVTRTTSHECVNFHLYSPQKKKQQHYYPNTRRFVSLLLSYPHFHFSQRPINTHPYDDQAKSTHFHSNGVDNGMERESHIEWAMSTTSDSREESNVNNTFANIVTTLIFILKIYLGVRQSLWWRNVRTFRIN